MALTNSMVSKAEDMHDCYEDAMSSIRCAIEVLRQSRDESAADFADDLELTLSAIKEDDDQYVEVLDEDQRLEEAAMNREYWRAVI